MQLVLGGEERGGFGFCGLAGSVRRTNGGWASQMLDGQGSR